MRRRKWLILFWASLSVVLVTLLGGVIWGAFEGKRLIQKEHVYTFKKYSVVQDLNVVDSRLSDFVETVNQAQGGEEDLQKINREVEESYLLMEVVEKRLEEENIEEETSNSVRAYLESKKNILQLGQNICDKLRAGEDFSEDLDELRSEVRKGDELTKRINTSLEGQRNIFHISNDMKKTTLIYLVVGGILIVGLSAIAYMSYSALKEVERVKNFVNETHNIVEGVEEEISAINELHNERSEKITKGELSEEENKKILDDLKEHQKELEKRIDSGDRKLVEIEVPSVCEDVKKEVSSFLSKGKVANKNLVWMIDVLESSGEISVFDSGEFGGVQAEYNKEIEELNAYIDLINSKTKDISDKYGIK